MFRHYCLTAIRILKKRLSSTIIQSIGLAIGLTVFMLVQVVAEYEENFDTFFTKSDRIYTAYIHINPRTGLNMKSINGIYTAFQPVMSINVPEVEKSARLLGREHMVKSGDKKFFEALRYVDPDFLEIFDLEFIYGNARGALPDPNSVILSESIARKYFGDANPLGKLITVENQHELQVTGIFADLPPNSHFTTSITSEGSFSMVATTGALNRIEGFDLQGSWRGVSSDNLTYILLAEGTDVARVEESLRSIYDQHLNDQDKEFVDGFGLRPLQKMNLFLWESTGIPAMAAIRILGLIVLMIACLNYTTMAAARGLSRLREVGLRKSIGANRGQLVFQFLVESVFIALIALIIAVVLTKSAVPVIGRTISRPIVFQPLDNPATLGGLVFLMLLTGLFAGGYPAFVISRVKITDALRGETGRLGKPNVMRNVLLVIQYTFSVVLVIAVIVTFAQNRKMQAGAFSYHRDHVVNVYRMSGSDIASHFDALRSGWQAIPNVEYVTISSQVPFEQRLAMSQVSPVSGDESRKIDLLRIDIGEDFADTYDLNLLAGRNLTVEYAEDSYRRNEDNEYAQSMVNAVINMSVVTAFGYESAEDAVGKFYYEVGDEATDVTYRIVGVFEDVNFLGPHTQIRPTAFYMPEEVPQVASIRVSTENLPTTLNQIDAVWDRVLPDYPIDRGFLDDRFNEIYTIFQGINAALLAFAVIGVSLALIGLFGMTVFLTDGRTKEIGVRKVLGASVTSLIRMLTWQISRPVLIATIIAEPLAYFATITYLNFFTDRISLSLPFFLEIGLLVMIFPWLIVGIQAYKVSVANPAEVLRYE
ncbi:ABC transporter permease [Candidatus Neomarinimicrobiota bacterium]